jgi:hypothetical protein
MSAKIITRKIYSDLSLNSDIDVGLMTIILPAICKKQKIYDLGLVLFHLSIKMVYG